MSEFKNTRTATLERKNKEPFGFKLRRAIGKKIRYALSTSSFLFYFRGWCAVSSR